MEFTFSRIFPFSEKKKEFHQAISASAISSPLLHLFSESEVYNIDYLEGLSLPFSQLLWANCTSASLYSLCLTVQLR